MEHIRYSAAACQTDMSNPVERRQMRSNTDRMLSIIDSAGTTYTVHTNCAGNFYVKGDQFTPVYPYWVSLRDGDQRDDMASPVYREGSCGACHTNPRSSMSPGDVYLLDDPTTEMVPAGGCQ